MSTPQQALQRSLRSLTIGTVETIAAAEAAVAEDRLQEQNQQFQIPIAGLARQGITWVKKQIAFAVVFVPAPSQRKNSSLVNPLFTYGVEIVRGNPADDPEPVLVSCVVEYITDDKSNITGCWLNVGLHSPTPDAVNFNGLVHLNFQGYGAIADYESDDD